MSLLKHGALAEDAWVAVTDDAPLPETGSPIMS